MGAHAGFADWGLDSAEGGGAGRPDPGVLALALLILAILGGAAALTNGTSFGEALRAKFVEMVGKIQ